MSVLRKFGILFLVVLLLVVFISIPTSTTQTKALGKTLAVTILEPAHGTEIPYCTHFTVRAKVTALNNDTISLVTAKIEITGNAELVSDNQDQGITSLG